MLLVGGGLGNAVLFSIGQALRAPGRGALLRRLQEGDRPLQGGGDRGRGRRRRVVLRRGAGSRPDAGRRTAPSSATSSQAMRAYAAGRARRRPIAARRRRPPDRDRLRPDDGAVARAHAAVLAPYLKPDHRRDRLDQLADAVHDEGDLRAVPAAAPRSPHRPAQPVFSCFNQDQPLDSSLAPGRRGARGGPPPPAPAPLCPPQTPPPKTTQTQGFLYLAPPRLGFPLPPPPLKARERVEALELTHVVRAGANGCEPDDRVRRRHLRRGGCSLRGDCRARSPRADAGDHSRRAARRAGAAGQPLRQRQRAARGGRARGVADLCKHIGFRTDLSVGQVLEGLPLG